MRRRETEAAGRTGDDDGTVAEVGLRCYVPTEEGAPCREADSTEAPDDRELERVVGDDRGAGHRSHADTSARRRLRSPPAARSPMRRNASASSGDASRARPFGSRRASYVTTVPP